MGLIISVWLKIVIVQQTWVHIDFLKKCVKLKNAVFWDVAPCRSCVNRRFGGTYRLHLQSRSANKPNHQIQSRLLLVTQCLIRDNTIHFACCLLHVGYSLSLKMVLWSCGILVNIFQATQQSAATCSRWFFARGFLYPEDGGDTFLRNVGSHKMYTAPHPRRRNSSYLPPWKSQNLHVWNCWWNTWKNPFVPPCKPGFITDQRGWKSPISRFSKACEIVHGRVHLCPYINQDILRISMAEIAQSV
jgi:hypothetical protein